MSSIDGDTEFLQDSDQDEEQYDFEYEDDDDEHVGDPDVENRYYNAKTIKDEEPRVALVEFFIIKTLPAAADGDWDFRSFKQSIKLQFVMGLYRPALHHYRLLLDRITSRSMINYYEKSVGNMCIFVGEKAESARNVEQARAAAHQFYLTTLDRFKDGVSQRIWLKVGILLAHMYLRSNRTVPLAKLLSRLHLAVRGKDGRDDPLKAVQVLEILSIEIQMLTFRRHHKRLKQLYRRALVVETPMPHPKVIGIIKECGAKMHLRERNWDGAYADFFSSFKSYAEGGSSHKIRVLKYLILTAMLMRSTIDPLDSQEARPYKDDPAIVAMTNMVKAYDKEDILGYEQNLRHHKELMDDPFVAENISDVTRNIRMKAITTYIVPYAKFTLDALCKELYIPRADLGELIVFMALNDGLRAQIDESTGHVRIDRLGQPDRSAIQTWSAVTRENLDRLVDKSNMGFPMRQSHDLKKKRQGRPGRSGGKKRGGGGKDDGGDDEGGGGGGGGGGGKGGRKRAPNTGVAVPARFKAQGGAKGTAGRKGPGPAATSATPIRPSKPGKPPRSAMRIDVGPATGGHNSGFISSPTTSNGSRSSSPRQGGGIKCHGGLGGCELRPLAPGSPLGRFEICGLTGAADELAHPPPYQLA